MSESLRGVCFTRGAAILAILAGSLSGAIADESLPRYRLEPGQEFSYRGRSEFKYEGGKFLTGESWRVWVARENPGGGWRLILRQGQSFTQVRDDDKRTEKPSDDENVTFAWCDLQPDGTFEANDSLGLRLDPAQILPRLPANADEARTGWKVRNERMDETQVCRLREAPADGKCEIEAVHESPMNEIYGIESRRVVTFDMARGLPARFVLENRQTYGFKGQGEGSLEFVEEPSHSADWVREFLADAEKYFAAQGQYQKTLRRKDLSAENLKSALEDSVKKLEQAGEQIQTPELKKLLIDQSAQRESYIKYAVDELAERANLLGTPSEEWTTTDLSGRMHALSDYRGKVVVLDFWYRGCGWCIRAMPQMKQVAAHFEGRPVVVFGMNTDQKEEDAQFVIDKMGLTYPNLKATGIPEKYKVSGFPTLVILDQKGVIRDVHVGYSPTLREEVVKSVEGLLEEGG